MASSKRWRCGIIFTNPELSRETSPHRRSTASSGSSISSPTAQRPRRGRRSPIYGAGHRTAASAALPPALPETAPLRVCKKMPVQRDCALVASLSVERHVRNTRKRLVFVPNSAFTVGGGLPKLKKRKPRRQFDRRQQLLDFTDEIHEVFQPTLRHLQRLILRCNNRGTPLLPCLPISSL